MVLALRDLFQTVYEMKKQEIDDAKAKAEGGIEDQTEGQTEGQKGQTEGQAEDSDKTEVSDNRVMSSMILSHVMVNRHCEHRCEALEWGT